MNDLLELIEDGWKIEIQKLDQFTTKLTATKHNRILEYSMDPSHPEKKLILLDTLNFLKIASKG